jgi:hypothetical protein
VPYLLFILKLNPTSICYSKAQTQLHLYLKKKRIFIPKQNIEFLSFPSYLNFLKNSIEESNLASAWERMGVVAVIRFESLIDVLEVFSNSKEIYMPLVGGKVGNPDVVLGEKAREDVRRIWEERK